MPDELGGDNPGPNPEQLFAAGYAACLHGALSLLARRHLLDPAAISVEATVAFGRDPADCGHQPSPPDQWAPRSRPASTSSPRPGGQPRSARSGTPPQS
ncbi:OsmC family protein [Nonomuraea sp. NEAU-L178]|nr:OsmC family protein [Nonomuraea aurantiaca]